VLTVRTGEIGQITGNQFENCTELCISHVRCCFSSLHRQIGMYKIKVSAFQAEKQWLRSGIQMEFAKALGEKGRPSNDVTFQIWFGAFRRLSRQMDLEQCRCLCIKNHQPNQKSWYDRNQTIWHFREGWNVTDFLQFLFSDLQQWIDKRKWFIVDQRSCQQDWTLIR
jgi:hypothetical protein